MVALYEPSDGNYGPVIWLKIVAIHPEYGVSIVRGR